MKFIRIAALSIVLIATAMPASAQWTNVAPNLFKDGKALGKGAMAYINGKLWAAHGLDLWMSSDDGFSWNDRTGGAFVSGENDIDFFDSTNAVAVYRDVICITTDGGKTWTRNFPGIGSRYYAAKFIASASEIVVSGETGVAITRDGGVTWTLTSFSKPSIKGGDVQTTRSGVIHVMLLQRSITSDSSHIATSTDYGATWSYSAGGFNSDCWSFALDPCDDKRFYVINENGFEPNGETITRVSCIYVSSDRGASWQITDSSASKKYCGSVRTTKSGTVLVQTYQGIIRSIDQGLSWQNIGGPPGLTDSRNIAYKNDNTIFVMDTGGSIWRTTNGGGFPIQYSGRLTITPSFLFDKKGASLCDTITDKVTLTSTGCNPPTVQNSTITGSAAGDYAVVFRDKDSIIVRFHPSSVGSRPATLVITLSDGKKFNVTLGGSGLTSGYTVTATPAALFDGDSSSRCRFIYRTVRISFSGCNIPTITGYSITGAAAGDYRVFDLYADGANLNFRARAYGQRNAMLTFQLSDGNTINIPLLGKWGSQYGPLRVEPTTLFERDTILTCKSIVRCLQWQGDICLDSVAYEMITGIAAGDYTITNPASPVTNNPNFNFNCIKFSPSVAGFRSAVYTIVLTDSTKFVIPLLGNGIDPGPALIAIPNVLFEKDTISLCSSITRGFRIRSNVCVNRNVVSQVIGGTASTDYTALIAAPSTLTGDDSVTIMFTPSIEGIANADYVLTMADGRKLIVPLAAVGTKGSYRTTVSPDTLFKNDSLYVLCQNSSGSATVTISGCPLPHIVSESIIGGAANDYLLKTKATDSLITPYTFDITFTPSVIGTRDAEYKLMFDDGSSVSVPLLGYGLKSSKLLTLATDPAFATDTLGGLISVPIKILGLDSPRTLELTVSFDTNLQYLGTTSLAGMSVDIPLSTTKNSSRIHLAPAQVNITGTSAYANFNVFAGQDIGRDIIPTYLVSLDSLSVLDAQSPCEFAGNASVAATITGPSGCGFIAISNFLRYNRSPQFRIYPNPTNSTITVGRDYIPTNAGNDPTSPGRNTIPSYLITVVDALGSVRLTQSDNPIIDLSSLPSGLYFVRVSGYGTAIPVVLGK